MITQETGFIWAFFLKDKFDFKFHTTKFIQFMTPMLSGLPSSFSFFLLSPDWMKR
jgi:hypothetical protein